MFGVLVGAGLVIVGTVVLVRHRHGVHRSMFGCALRRLKSTPEQRERLSPLFDAANSRLASIRERARALRGELADIMAAPVVEPQRLEALETQLFEVLGEGTQVLHDSITRVHDTLNSQQREQVANWLRRAPHHHCHSAPCHG
jgi:uncharacterized membrane protein